MVKSLLEGGATVIATTSRLNADATDMYQSLYGAYGARDSKLILFPFNMASRTDVHDLIHHVYSVLQVDVDYVIPFAAAPQLGNITDIGDRAELCTRMMLTNVVRLLGELVLRKSERCIYTRPALVLLPLSPNHGIMGGDGLYGEAKRGLEALLNKWSSEDWSDFLSITGIIDMYELLLQVL
tara:strand:+ start:567 stop:1112 length:546 start_codon:yes stop_codon:yes gene_type:complete